MTSSHSHLDRFLETEDQYGRIIRVEEDRLDEALTRLLMVDGQLDPAHVAQFRAYSEQNRIALDHCWGRLDHHGRVRQAVLAILNPGRTAMVFASRIVGQDEIPAIGALIDHCTQALATRDVRMAQALLHLDEHHERRAFARGGFTELARLSYLERPVPTANEVPAAQWPREVTLETYREDLIDDFLTALEASYDQTLDCPALRGLRQTTDILEGHRGTGQFDPSLWTLMRLDHQPSGLILLNPASSQQSIELVYLGLSPRARGRGLGLQLLRHGLHAIAGRTERSISLAVDEKNTPAIKLYTRAGFVRSLRRLAMIRPLNVRASSTSPLK